MRIRGFYIFVFVLFSHFSYGQNPDIGLLRHIHIDRNERLEPGFLFITHSAGPVSIATPISQIGYGLILRDNTQLRNGYTSGASLLLASVVTTSLKYAINRDRPYMTYADIRKGARADLPSFPSGHTTLAFVTATSLSLAYPKWYVIAPSFAWAGAVGYSRMFLGVHYPSDVLAGAIIGSGAAFLCYKVGRRVW